MTTVRKRRIAADEAHSWARNLRLGNPYAKLVLSMLTLYVQGDGICFVGIDQLADDTELSADTVRKRLAWLENIGAIARFPQWLDAGGRRNADGKGKRTTDEIRLLIDADPAAIEARAAGDTDDGAAASETSVSPGCQQGLNPSEQTAQPSVSPALALGQPSDSGKGLDSSNLNLKTPPYPPPGGAVDQVLEADIAEIARVYPAPITNLPRLRTLLTAMSVDERRRVITGARGYAAFIADCTAKRKPRAVKDAHSWVQNGLWQGYLGPGERAEAAARMQQVATDSVEGRAYRTLHRIAHLPPPFETGGKFLLREPLTPQVLALAHAPPESEWPLIAAADRNRCAAWTDLIAGALSGTPRPALVWDRNPGGVSGFLAPWEWPPRKDGSLATAPPVAAVGMLESEMSDFKP